MTDTFRALCADLVAAWDKDYPWDYVDDPDLMGALLFRAHAALAEQPVEPTESDVTELFYRHMGEGSEVGFENAIAEALARWGHPATPPEPVGPTDEELLELWKGWNLGWDPQKGTVLMPHPAKYARAVLAKWGQL